MRKDKIKLLAVAATLFFSMSVVPTVNAAPADNNSIAATMAKLQKIQSAKKNIKGKYQKINDNGITRYSPESNVRLIIQLEEKAAKDYVKVGELKEASNDPSIMGKVNKVQKSYVSKVLGVDKNTKVINNYNLLFNGFSVETKYKNIDKIANIDGIKKVSVAKQYYPQVVSARDMANVKAVYEQYGIKGEGTVISIIDTGMDPEHKDLTISNPSKVKIKTKPKKGDPGKYFSVKIPYGYNFADKDTKIKDTNPTNSMHGMHVGGIAASNCQSDEEVSLYKGVKGIAPEAQLMVMKVFSNNPNFSSAFNDDTLAAIESSVAHGADVINLSLGSSSEGFEGEDDPEIAAVNEAARQGVLCVIAAGNSEYATAPYKMNVINDSSTVGSPATSDGCLAVASVQNSMKLGYKLDYSYIKDGKVESLEMTCSIAERQGGPALNPAGLTNDDKGYEVVDCGKAFPEDLVGIDVKGKIALIERGTTTYAEKVDNVQKLGAVAAVIYNNKDDADYGILITDIDKIPAVAVVRKNGLQLKELLNSGLRIKFYDKTGAVENPAAGDMAESTSWGCTSRLEIKPEISGIGGNVYSTANDNGYQTLSGTSMASPFVAGVEALMVQRINQKDINIHNENRVNVIKNLTVAAAKPMKGTSSGDTYFSPRRQGAGMVDARAAIANNVTITYNNKPVAAIKEISNTATFELTLKNYGKKDATYAVKDLCGGVLTEQNQEVISTMTYDVVMKGSKVSFNSDTVTVKAGKTAKVKVTINIPKNADKNIYAEGFIGFESQTEGVESIGIPYMGFYGKWDEGTIVDAPVWDESSVFGNTSLVMKQGEEDPIQLGVVAQDEDGYVTIDKDAIAISTNSESAYTSVCPSLWLLRNARNVVIEVRNSKHEVIRTLSSDDKIEKQVFSSSNSDVNSPYMRNNWQWDGTVYDSKTGSMMQVEDGQYYIAVRSVIDFKGAKYQTVEMPVKVDSVKPIIKQISSEFTDGGYKIVFKAQDGENGSGIKPLEGFGFTVDGETYTDADGNSLFTLESNENGEYTALLNISNEAHEVIMTTFDNAGNMAETFIGQEYESEGFNVFFDNFSADARYNSLGITVTGQVTELPKVFKIGGNNVKINDDLTFAVPVTLEEGWNKIPVHTEDKKGQVWDYAMTVTADTTAPVINVKSMRLTGDTTYAYVSKNANTFTIKGNVRDNASVFTLYINGESIVTSLGNRVTEKTLPKEFENTITLNGSRTVITLKAIDELGNVSQKQIIVIKR